MFNESIALYAVNDNCDECWKRMYDMTCMSYMTMYDAFKTRNLTQLIVLFYKMNEHHHNFSHVLFCLTKV